MRILSLPPPQLHRLLRAAERVGEVEPTGEEIPSEPRDCSPWFAPLPDCCLTPEGTIRRFREGPS